MYVGTTELLLSTTLVDGAEIVVVLLAIAGFEKGNVGAREAKLVRALDKAAGEEVALEIVEVPMVELEPAVWLYDGRAGLEKT